MQLFGVLLVMAATKAAPLVHGDKTQEVADEMEVWSPLDAEEGEQTTMTVPGDQRAVHYEWSKEGRVLCTGTKIKWCLVCKATWRHWCDPRYPRNRANTTALTIHNVSVADAGRYIQKGTAHKPWRFQLGVVNLAKNEARENQHTSQEETPVDHIIQNDDRGTQKDGPGTSTKGRAAEQEGVKQSHMDQASIAAMVTATTLTFLCLTCCLTWDIRDQEERTSDTGEGPEERAEGEE